ncbi:MAG: TatD family hydrolase [Sandaracinus sp.]|nr:TatD family hydrolase [Sandaracinus sp.]
MRFFDAHAHLDFETFDADRDEVLERAAKAGIGAVVLPGVSRAQWERAHALVRRGHPDVRLAMAVGHHPEHLDPTLDPLVLEAQLVDAAERFGAVAIGECGLDRRVEAQVDLERQLAVLGAHVRAAKRTGLPLVLHVVRRDGPMLDALRPHAPLRGMVHAFTGSAETARAFVALGLHLSFGGALTRPNARRIREAAAAIPADRVLLETDAPDQSPTGAPTERNEPAYLPLVATALDRPEVDAAANAHVLFGWP